MPRRVLFVVLYVLLLGLQREGYRHGFDHLRQQLAQAHERALQLPAEPCDECGLLAGAAHAAIGDASGLVDGAHDDLAASWPAHAHTPRILRAFAARAPPVLV